jgi:hypothetical protein
MKLKSVNNRSIELKAYDFDSVEKTKYREVKMQSIKNENTNIIAVKMKMRSNNEGNEYRIQKMLDVILNNETVRSLMILSSGANNFLTNSIEDFFIVPDNRGDIHKIYKKVTNHSNYHVINLIRKENLIIHNEKGLNQFKKVSLKPIINEAVKTYKIQAQRKGIEISFHSDKNLPLFFGNKDGLKQIAEDLIKTAIDLTNGKININLIQDYDFTRLNVEVSKSSNLQSDQTGISEKFKHGHCWEMKDMTKILLIEDDQDITKVLKKDLDRAGFEVISAKNDREAIKNLNGSIPALIVCDIMIDTECLIGFLTRIFHDPKLSSIPFIYLTAYPSRIYKSNN